MKKVLLVLTFFATSVFALAGCGKEKTTKKVLGEKISSEEALNKIDAAENLLNSKQYSSVFNQKTNEKADLDYEIESKISIKWDYTQEINVDIKKSTTAFTETIIDKGYGASKGSGTDWYINQNDARSFASLYNSSSPNEFCKKNNEESKKYDVEKYGYIEDETLYLSTKNNKYILDSAVTENSYSNYEEKLEHGSLNTYHSTITDLIYDGFDEELLEAYYNGKCLTIKFIDGIKLFEKDEVTGQVFNKDFLRSYFYSTSNSRAIPAFYPENFEFMIEITFNEDGSYSTFNSNYSFDSTYRNYSATIMTFVSNGARPTTQLKESYGKSKITSTQTETFNYSNPKINVPSWYEE